MEAPSGLRRGIEVSNNCFILIALTRIRTRDLWLWYHIKLYAPEYPVLLGVRSVGSVARCFVNTALLYTFLAISIVFSHLFDRCVVNSSENQKNVLRESVEFCCAYWNSTQFQRTFGADFCYFEILLHTLQTSITPSYCGYALNSSYLPF